MALRGKSPKQARPSRPRIAVFGAPGIGKTWESLDFPACYYLDVEGGANLPHYVKKLENVGAQYVGPEDGAGDFDVVLAEIQALRTTKHDRKTVIVDSFSKLFQNEIQAEVERLERAGKEPAFGSEKKPAIGKSRRLVRLLDTLDMNAILIMHERAQWEKGEEIGRTFDGWDKLAYELNLVLQVVKQGASRKARVLKSRFEQFNEGELVDWTVETFRERFGADVLDAVSVSLEPATDEQVDQMRELLEVTRCDEKMLAKWREAAGVTDWSEMDAKTIQACIDRLRNPKPKAA